MSITLADGYTGIQTVTSGGVLTGNYGAAGTLADFGGSPANGTWELYFADLSNGGGTSTLDSWTLNITAVPEPVNIALAIFGGIGVVFGIRRYRSPKCRAANRMLIARALFL